jgi:hypothetical protein
MIARDIHRDSLATSTALSEYYVENFITPSAVIPVLNAAGVRFMLVGAHGIGGWMNAPRTTEDVDIVVGVRGDKKAVRVLLAAFPTLEADEHDIVTRLRHRDTKKVMIDVIKPHEPLFRAAFKHTHAVKAYGESFSIPSLEFALAMKFASMIGPNRIYEKKLLDAHDFILMVKSNPEIAMDILAELGQLVYNGGAAEIVEKVRQVRAGERMKI